MKRLIFTAAILLGLPAMATEITSPFYQPEAGHVLSQTQASFTKSKRTPSIRTYHQSLDEKITLGVGAGLSVLISGDLNWTRRKDETTTSAPHTKGYSAGLKGQWALGGILSQFNTLYHQSANVNFAPRRTLETHLRFGKELKKLTPYLHLVGNFPLNARPEFNAPIYRGETGVFQHINDKMTLDTALYLQYDKNEKGKSYGIQGEWSYLTTSWMAFSLNGAWQARGHAKNGAKTYQKRVGVSLRFAF